MRLRNRTMKDGSSKSTISKKTFSNEPKINHTKGTPKRTKFDSSEADNIPGPSYVVEPAETADVNNILDLNSYVLENVFTFLDCDSLKSCRLVSKYWSGEASKELGRKSTFKLEWDKELPLYVQPGVVRRSKRNKGIKKDSEPMELEMAKLFGLHTCFCSLSDPFLLVNFGFDLDWLVIPEFKNLLQKFGSNLRSINIGNSQILDTDDLNGYSNRMTIIQQILTEWCPNLLHFQIEMNRKPSKKPLQRVINFAEIKNLTSFEMHGILTDDLVDFYISLIKACRTLVKLSISFVPERKSYTGHSNETLLCDSFFEKLTKLPKVTKQLEEFSWNGNKTVSETSCNILRHVYAMQFSKELNTFGFGPSSDCPRPNKQYLLRVLEKLNAYSVKSIVFNGKYWRPRPIPEGAKADDSSDEEDAENPDIENEHFVPLNLIPVMPTVEMVKSTSDNNYGLGYLKFVHKFPNLQKLEMSSEVVNRVDDFESDWKYLSELPHFNLKTLVVNPTAYKVITLSYMVDSFPNLTHLYLQVGTPLYNNTRGCYCCWRVRQPKNEISIPEAVSNAAKLTSLKEFKLTFLEKYSPHKVSEALALVENFPKLEVFSFGLMEDAEIPNQVTFAKIKYGLSKLRQLPCRVRLAGYKLNTTEQKKFKAYVEKNNIQVDLAELEENVF